MKNDTEHQEKKSPAPKPLGTTHEIYVTFTKVEMDEGHVDIYRFLDDKQQAAREYNKNNDKGVMHGDSVTWSCNVAFLVLPKKAKQLLGQDASTPILVTPTNPTPVAYGSQFKGGWHKLTLEVQGNPGDELGYILLAGAGCSDLTTRKRLENRGGPWHTVSTPIVRATIILAS